ncbi:MAG: biotin--[acetyl-CoA-carboxylase] ligase [Anaerolineae bacterium]
MDTELDQAAIKAALHNNKIIGGTLETYRTIDSTNTRAVLLAHKGAPDGTLVLAEEQTSGRGRLGRTWTAPPFSALLFSLVLRPHLQPIEVPRLAMITSLAVCRAIDQLYGLQAGVKWPNDIELEGRKLGGMLSEVGLQGSQVTYVVLGLGLNVNLDPGKLGDVMVPAASISAALGHDVERLPLLAAILEEIEREYGQVNQGWLPHEDWRARLVTLGKHVRTNILGEITEGLAEDVDANGALLVRLQDGTLRTVLAGDVTLRQDS